MSVHTLRRGLWVPKASVAVPDLALRGTPTTGIDTSTSTNTVTVNAPTGLAEGDLVYLIGGANGNNHDPATWPSGFDLLDEYDTRGSYIGVARDIMGASPPSTFQMQTSGNQRMGLICVAFQKDSFNSTTPEDDTGVAGSDLNATDPIPVPGITTNVNGSWFLQVASVQSSSSTHVLVPPGAMTELATADYRVSGNWGGVLYAYYEKRDTAGATGSRDWQNDQGRPHAYMPFGVRQAA